MLVLLLNLPEFFSSFFIYWLYFILVVSRNGILHFLDVRLLPDPWILFPGVSFNCLSQLSPRSGLRGIVPELLFLWLTPYPFSGFCCVSIICLANFLFWIFCFLFWVLWVRLLLVSCVCLFRPRLNLRVFRLLAWWKASWNFLVCVMKARIVIYWFLRFASLPAVKLIRVIECIWIVRVRLLVRILSFWGKSWILSLVAGVGLRDHNLFNMMRCLLECCLSWESLLISGG